MAVPVEILITVGSLIGAGGAAWGGAKVALNGTRSRVKELVESHAALNMKMESHVAHDAEVQVELVERQARMEGKIDTLLDRMR